MEKEVRRSILSGKVAAPPSVAMAHRAILLSMLAPGQTIVSNVPRNGSITATIAACESFGADIASEGGVVDIFGPDEIFPPETVDCEESSATLKLFMPLAALFGKEVEFIGSGKLAGAPMGNFCDYFGALFVSAKAEEGRLPMKMTGPIAEGEIAYFPILGTQLLSGLLLAAPLRAADTAIAIAGKMHGDAYVRATVEMMKESGIAFVSEEPGFYYLKGMQPYLPPDEIVVPGSAHLSSFLALAGVVAGKVEVNGVPDEPALGKLFGAFSAKVRFEDGKLLSSLSALEGARLDALAVRERLAQALVLASSAAGETKISNVKKLGRGHEKQLRLIVRELSRMGAKITETDEGLSITGGKLKGAQIEPEGDPRVAMACAVAALTAQGPSTISGAECIDRAYPGFFSDLEKLGAIIR